MNTSTPQELVIVNDNTQDRCGSGLPWNRKDWKDETCAGEFINDNGDIIVRGQVNNLDVEKIMYWAAAPPTYGTSFSGSGHPYPNPIVAFDRTPNRGVAKIQNGSFEFRMKYPNSYYVGLGSLYIPPHVNFKLCLNGKDENDPGNKTSTIVIDDGIPFRTLTYPAPPSKKPRVSPMFYCEPWHGARTQEQILRQSGYPSTNKTPDNFWGTKPPR
jgi:hypothetical protein